MQMRSILIKSISSTSSGECISARLRRFLSGEVSESEDCDTNATRFSYDNHTLEAVTNRIYSMIDWDNLFNTFQDCDWNQQRSGFESYSQLQANSYVVVTKGRLACSMQELRNALSESNTQTYNDTMSAIFGNSFVYGLLRHKAMVNVRSHHEQEESFGGDVDPIFIPNCQECDVAIKSAVFARSNFMNRNEQWDYLDFIHDRPDKSGFTKILSSIHDPNSLQEVQRGLSHLHSIIAGYAVENVEMEGNQRECRLLFYAKYFEGHTYRSKVRKASSRKIQKRLDNMSAAIPRLLALVYRRRLGAQIMIDKKRLQDTNIECVCCNILLKKDKNQCQLCGNAACKTCSTRQYREEYGKRPKEVDICKGCLARVETCNFSKVHLEDLKPFKVRPNSEGTPSTASVLAGLLQKSFSQADTSKKSSVIAVVKQMTELLREESEATASDSDIEKYYTGVSQSQTALLESEYFQMLEEAPIQEIHLDNCVLANAEARSYALNYVNPSDRVPLAPISDNETKRLQVIEKQNLFHLGDIEELNIICDLIAKEIDCQVGFVTIIGEHEMLAIASSIPEFRQSRMPRNQSVCSHLLASDIPLIVPSLQADVRFSDTGVIKILDAEFYCGFPLILEDNVVVGTVCCLNRTNQQVTESQYNAMARLARTASKIVQIRSQSIAST